MKRLVFAGLLVSFSIVLAFAEEVVPAAIESAPQEAKTETVEVVAPQPAVEEKNIPDEAPQEEAVPQKSEEAKPDAA